MKYFFNNKLANFHIKLGKLGLAVLALLLLPAAGLCLTYHVNNGALQEVVVRTGGTGYSIGDIITAVQGGASGGKVRVTSLVGNGGVAGVEFVSETQGSQGAGYNTANDLAVTGGLGAGCKLDIYAITGSDSNNGTFSNTPWLTIAKINASTFNGDDQAQLIKGGLWRETLTAPSSGSAGSPITFGAYGGGAAPIIDGADLVATWSANASIETWGDFTGAGNDTSSASINFRSIINETELSTGGTQIRITVGSSTAASKVLEIASAYIGEKAASGDAYDMEAGTISQILFSGIGTATVPNASTVTSDWLTFTINETKSYITSIGISTNATNNACRSYTATGKVQYYKNAGGTDSGTANVSTYATIPANNSYALQKVEIQGGVSNVWQATLTTQPSQVFFDGTRGTSVASAALCTSAGKWFWGANVLYVYSASDPDSAFTSPGIEASVRDYCITTSSKNYLTFSDFYLDKANLNGLLASWQPNTIVASGFTVDNSYGAGAVINGTSPAFTIQNSTVQNSGLYGIAHNHADNLLQYITGCMIQNNGWRASNSSGWNGTIQTGEISGNTVTNNGIGSTAGLGHGLYVDVGQATTSLKIYGNTIYSNTKGAGILAKSGVEIYSNLIYSNNNEGISAGQNGVTNVAYNFHNNIIHSNLGGITIKTKGAGTLDAGLYNNTLYQNGAQAEVLVSSDLTSLNVKNNIGHATATTGGNISVVTQTGTVVIDNNAWYRASSLSLNYAGAKTWGEWQGLGCDVSGVNTDPLFVNAAGGGFHLSALSPCIDAGIDWGQTGDFTGTRAKSGSAWDIGAYEFQHYAKPSSGLTLRVLPY